ncbi:MAG: 16S rRNA (adenine(1518)-N(6)/adenine(1519)-N(6))-dimethyltransferase RsmA [bacterium]|nr:16S rRNA (adenine(1518)-N(6)/adenine(1519)-N(6))-dimethyltransferase RsmA [bacterium]
MIHAAKKSLGQHFLNNPSLAQKIVRLADLQKGDFVLEIGPGRGILTLALLHTGARVVAIEKDRDLVLVLREKFKGTENLEIVEGDALEILNVGAPTQGCPTKVIANLPYNIATEVIFRLLDQKEKFSDFFLMVQKEVAERLAAGPGSKRYGILSVLTQIHADIKIVHKVAPTAFFPKPKVDSAVVHFKILPALRFPVDGFSFFKQVVKASFASRRKKLSNSLLDHLDLPPPVYLKLTKEKIEAVFEEIGLKPDLRAESLPLEKFVALANALY